MKILYICGTYCPSYGGAEISMHTLLKFMKKVYSAKILVLTDYKYTQNNKKSTYDTISLIGTSHKNRKKSIQIAIDYFKPDLIVTQLMWSDEALRIGKKNEVPTILRVCKIPFELDISKKSEFSPTGIICVSKAVKKYVKEKWGRDCLISIPPINIKKNILVPKSKFTDPLKRPYITMFNPLIRKGGEIFREISKKMPNETFAVVDGWISLKESVESINFSDRLIKRICESQGTKFTGKKPSYTDLSDCPNIITLKPTEEVWKIYSKTKILLIPSQWEEAFGRVAIEGMANRIPVIASKVGGLKEAIGNGGILVSDYNNPKEWIKLIRGILKKDNYHKLSSQGILWVKNNYSLKIIIKNSFNFFNKIAKQK